MPVGLGPGADFLVRSRPANAAGVSEGYALFRRGANESLVDLGLDGIPSSLPVFDRAGRLLAWGNTDGTIRVYALPQVEAWLQRVALDW
jgi:hypothetical protein